MTKDDEKLLDEAAKRIRDEIGRYICVSQWHPKQRECVKELDERLRRECDRYVKGKKKSTITRI